MSFFSASSFSCDQRFFARNCLTRRASDALLAVVEAVTAGWVTRGDGACLSQQAQ